MYRRIAVVLALLLLGACSAKARLEQFATQVRDRSSDAYDAQTASWDLHQIPQGGGGGGGAAPILALADNAGAAKADPAAQAEAQAASDAANQAANQGAQATAYAVASQAVADQATNAANQAAAAGPSK